MPYLRWITAGSDWSAFIGYASLRVRHNGREGADAAYTPSIQVHDIAEDLAEASSLTAAQDIAERYVRVPQVHCTLGMHGRRSRTHTWRTVADGDVAGGLCKPYASFAIASWYPRLPSPAVNLISVHGTERGAVRRFSSELRDPRTRAPLPRTRAVAIFIPITSTQRS